MWLFACATVRETHFRAKNVKNFVGFWGMRRQNYLLLRFTDIYQTINKNHNSNNHRWRLQSQNLQFFLHQMLYTGYDQNGHFAIFFRSFFISKRNEDETKCQQVWDFGLRSDMGKWRHLVHSGGYGVIEREL